MLRAQQWWLRLRVLFRRDHVAHELDDEMQFHLDQQIAENVALGKSREEARNAALRCGPLATEAFSRSRQKTHGPGCGLSNSLATSARVRERSAGPRCPFCSCPIQHTVYAVAPACAHMKVCTRLVRRSAAAVAVYA
jgi:hypothetical protein